MGRSEWLPNADSLLPSSTCRFWKVRKDGSLNKSDVIAGAIHDGQRPSDDKSFEPTLSGALMR